MRKSWIDIIRISRHDEEWEANQFSRICSNHFAETDIYLTSKGFRKIKKTATPFYQVPKHLITYLMYNFNKE